MEHHISAASGGGTRTDSLTYGACRGFDQNTRSPSKSGSRLPLVLLQLVSTCSSSLHPPPWLRPLVADLLKIQCVRSSSRLQHAPTHQHTGGGSLQTSSTYGPFHHTHLPIFNIRATGTWTTDQRTCVEQERNDADNSAEGGFSNGGQCKRPPLRESICIQRQGEGVIRVSGRQRAQ